MLYFDEPRVFGEHEQTMAEVIAAQVSFAVRRLEAEQAANDREAELRLVTDVAPAYIAHCDRGCRYLFVNRPFADRLQLTPEQVIGRDRLDLLGTEVYERLRPYVEAALRGERVELELELPYQHAGARLMQAKLAPALDGQGQVSGFVAVISDVTERRKADEARDALFRQLADRCPRWCGWPAPRADRLLQRAVVRSSRASARRDRRRSWVGIVHPDDLQRSLDVWYERCARARRTKSSIASSIARTNGYRWQLGRALPRCERRRQRRALVRHLHRHRRSETRRAGGALPGRGQPQPRRRWWTIRLRSKRWPRWRCRTSPTGAPWTSRRTTARGDACHGAGSVAGRRGWCCSSGSLRPRTRTARQVLQSGHGADVRRHRRHR